MQYCVVLWLLFSSALTAPADQPVTVDLPVYGENFDPDADLLDSKAFANAYVQMVDSKNSDAKVVFSKKPDAEVLASNTVKLSEPLEPEHPPGDDRRDRTLVTNLLAHKVQTASDVLKNRLLHSPPPHSAGFISHPHPLIKLESALLESEGLGSRKLSLKDNFHHFMADTLHPRPLVDIISEDEKYGNSGEKFTAVGKVIVGGAERVSSFVNSVLEVPGVLFRSITRAATEKLNALGGKLIGL